MNDSKPSWIGRTLDNRYQIDSLLGRGGMSTVYKANDPNLQRDVAIKIIHPHLSEEPEFVKRFEQEAAAVAQLRHPNIIHVHDFNTEGGAYYIVFEHVPGETLETKLSALKKANLRLPLAETVRILTSLSEAVAYAHERNMIHRDLKPSNVIIDLLGQPILMDFGIAKMIGSDHVHTATGATIGTAAYMAPEQVLSEPVDHRADIYSLGIMLYEMAGGKPPFEGTSAITVMMKHVNDPVPDIRLVNSNIPDALTTILEKALAKKQEKRYQSVVEMAADLRALSQRLVSSSVTQAWENDPGGITKTELVTETAVPPQPQPPPQPSPSQPQIDRKTRVPSTPIETTVNPPDGRRLPLSRILAAGVLLVLVAAAAYFFIPGLRQRLPTSEGMIAIPASEYEVGLENGGTQFAAAQTVSLAPFWIDRYEVSNIQYANFMAETDARAPAQWVGGSYPDGEFNFPVQGVTWEMADAYCQWARKRLPTEAEWEVAARGSQNQLYPWGNDESTVQLPRKSAYPVGSVAANRTPFGLYDMAGNVWEWVDEPYAPIPESQRVLRGGAYDFFKNLTYRLIGAPDLPTMIATAGFRCAADEVEVVVDEVLLLQDDFSDPEGGWPEVDEGIILSGYHPPDFYHLQAGQPNQVATAFAGGDFDNVSVETAVFVDSTDTPDNGFRYGIVVRRSGDDFYAFTISPRTESWAVLKNNEEGLQILKEGSADFLQGLTSADTLRVDASGSDFVFAVNGRVIAQINDPDYLSGDVGFFVETTDEERAHVHYDNIAVNRITTSHVEELLFQDGFANPDSGWPSISADGTLSGYHPPDFYHVQASEPDYRSGAFYHEFFDNFSAETKVFVEDTESTSGEFSYGLAVRRNGNQYYALLVSPRSNRWQVVKNNDDSQEILAEGDAEILGLSGMDELRVDAIGERMVYILNGRPLVEINDGAYLNGEVGFIVQTYDETKAHIHYDTLIIRRPDAELIQAPTAVPIAGLEPIPPTDPTAVPTEVPTLEPTPETPPVSALGMTQVDGGRYIVGTDTAVELAAFWIDKYEVSNAQYAEFLADTGQTPPVNWGDGAFPTEQADFPVFGVTWEQAKAYCNWNSKRLPTEAEWETAARGPQGWRYPWGNDDRAVPLPSSDTYAVGTLPTNRSFFGAFDMAGNVWEWVGEPYLPVAAGEEVIRGGANNFQNDLVSRFPGDPNSVLMFGNAGIRCAADRVIAESEPDLILSDDFADLESGWWQARAPVNAYFYGYHPSDFYHVQVNAPNDCLSVYREMPIDNFMAEVQIFVAATNTENSNFWYGLTLRETNNQFYAFIVSPRSQAWQVLKSTEDGLALLDEGIEASISGASQETRDRLFVIAKGPEMTFFVNGRLVSTQSDDAYPSGSVGFIVQTLDETYAHVHYDAINIWPLPTAAAPSETPATTSSLPISSPICRGTVAVGDTLVSFISHVVEEGENLTVIANQYGLTVEDILGANGKTITNPGIIRTGQTLVIPQS